MTRPSPVARTFPELKPSGSKNDIHYARELSFAPTEYIDIQSKLNREKQNV